mgnify:CR=1 FL=1
MPATCAPACGCACARDGVSSASPVGDAVSEVFCDNSLSAYKGVDRPRFKALCALIESGEWRQLPISRTCKDSDLNVITRIISEDTCKGLL